jgi:hypothetical protein
MLSEMLLAVQLEALTAAAAAAADTPVGYGLYEDGIGSYMAIPCFNNSYGERALVLKKRAAGRLACPADTSSYVCLYHLLAAPACQLPCWTAVSTKLLCSDNRMFVSCALLASALQ